MLNEPLAVTVLITLSALTIVWASAVIFSKADELDCDHRHKIIYSPILHFFIMIVYMFSYGWYVWIIHTMHDYYSERGTLRIWIRRMTLNAALRFGLTMAWVRDFMFFVNMDTFAAFCMGAHLFVVLAEFAGVLFAVYIDDIKAYVYSLATAMLLQLATIVVLVALTSAHVVLCS